MAFRRLALVVGGLILCGGLALIVLGEMLIYPAHRKIGNGPTGLPVLPVALAGVGR